MRKQMSPVVYFAILGALGLLITGALVTLVVVLVQAARERSTREPPAGHESPVYLAAGPTGYGKGSGDEVVEASGLAQDHRWHPKKKRLR